MNDERRAAGGTATKRIWITWERQRRNRTLSSLLNAELFEVLVVGGRLRRYVRSLAATLRILQRERPTVLFVQNPSLVLAAFSVLYGRLRRLPVVIDAHYAGIRPLEGKKRWANKLARWIAKLAHATIVTNRGHFCWVEEQGGRPFVLPDPMPSFPPTAPITLRGKHNVLFICTWAADEPYDQLLRAATLLPADCYVYVTGNPKGREKQFEPLPDNVVLTGYVAEEDYVALLASCDVIVDLTTRENCLVCGAYEAAAMGKAMVLSGTAALRDYFQQAGLYTDNTAADLAARIREAMEKKPALMAAADELAGKRRGEWQQTKQRLEGLLADLEAGKDPVHAQGVT